MPGSHWDDKKLKLPALHQAARRGNLAQVKKLLKGKKAKVNEAGEFGDTPIMWAAYEGNASVVAYLIAAGANVKAADKEKTTPLHLATGNGHCEIIAALLAKGANAKAMDGDGFTPLHWAAVWDYPDAIQVFTKSKVNANVRGIEGITALHAAAALGHPAAIRALIKGGADVNQADKNKTTPLHQAAAKNRYLSVGVLVDNGAVPSVKDDDGSTPLHLAADGGHEEIVKHLLDAGAKSNLSDKEGNTPLYYAQRGGHHGVAKMLIDRGQFATAKTPDDKNTAEKVFKQVSFSIVYIEAETAQGTVESGSGVIVKGNLVATNWHVVGDGEDNIRVWKAEKEKDRGIQIDLSGGSPSCLEATIFGRDPDQDFCLLKVPGLEGDAVEIRPYHDLRVGEDVYAIGNPLGETHTLSGGVISQKREDEEGRKIQTNAAISPGSSGGGLFDKEGNLIGITTESHPDKERENLNYAIAADLVWGFLPGKR